MLTRRSFLGGSLASIVACDRGPAVRTKLPAITHGVQAGDPQSDRGLVWARCSEPARMLVEWDTTDRFANARRISGPLVTPDGDHAATAELAGLPAGQTIVYRVRFEREASRGASAWATGRFRTPNTDRIRVAWTGDTCGQGFGRNPDFGGLRGFEAIRKMDPDVFVNSGDLIYADNPILPEKKLADGRVWKNISNDRVARVAESIDDFRARFAYNLEDEHYRVLASEVPVIAQWDDHETHNNWFPGQQLADDRYRERDASKLAAMAHRAMFEWMPMKRGPIHRVIRHGPLLDIFVLDCRSFRSPNTTNIAGERMLGREQADWLVYELARSAATWKVIACDQPLALAIDDGPNWEGFSNNDPGAAKGREIETEAVLRAIKTINDPMTGVGTIKGVRDRKNPQAKTVVWITADVHYAAAHHFDPSRGAGATFDPFWEFVAGPIHAGNFGPNDLDATFGPSVKFQWGTPPPNIEMLSPLDGKQSFGLIDVTREALTVSLRDIDDHELYKVVIPKH